MLSHLTAAERAGLVDTARDIIHVAVPDERKVRRTAGIMVHRRCGAGAAAHPARLPPQTRVEETVLDLAAAAATVDDACSWVLRSLQRRTTTQAKLARALARRPRIRWRCTLRELLTLDAAGLHSILEQRYERDVERPHGLPRCRRQHLYRRGEHNELPRRLLRRVRDGRGARRCRLSPAGNAVRRHPARQFRGRGRDPHTSLWPAGHLQFAVRDGRPGDARAGQARIRGRTPVLPRLPGRSAAGHAALEPGQVTALDSPAAAASLAAEDQPRTRPPGISPARHRRPQARGRSSAPRRPGT